MPSPANSVAVATGSLVVTGSLTTFVAAEFDILIIGGVAAVIASCDSTSRITLKQPWPGPDVVDATAWIIVNTGPYWQSSVSTSTTLASLIRKWEAGPVKWDASGPLSGRAAQNGQPKDFVYLAVDPLPFTLYVKLANTNSAADWSAGQALAMKPDSTTASEAARDAAQGYAAAATGQAGIATAAATQAQNAIATGKVGYDTLAQLQANLGPGDGAQGEVSNDPTPANNGIYRKNGASGGGSWVQTSILTLAQLYALTAFIRTFITQTPGAGFAFGDDIGSILVKIDENGLTAGIINVIKALTVGGGLTVGGTLDLPAVTISYYPDPNVTLIITDPAGWGIFALLANGKVICAGVTTPGSVGDYTSDEIAERSARAVALSAGYRGLLDTTSAAAIWAYNHAWVLGQSLGAGVEGWPAKTLTGRSDVLMIGQSVRPAGANGATSPTPLGDTTLRPAIATAQNANTGALLSPSQQAALSPGDASLGEEIGVAAMQFARRLFLQRAGVAAADDRRFVVTNVAVGGKSIEELSKGATPEYFNRQRVMGTAVKTAAAAAGGNYGICAGFMLQGEWNYAGTNGSSDKATFKAAHKQFRADFNADIATAIAGQADPPAWITYQTGGQYTVDATDLSIGQAQWELAQENDGWYLAGPSYPYTDKNGHLDPNGYRWLGCKMGQVFHETVILRRRWKPLSPIQATVRGRTVLIDFHLPSGTPLQFKPVYVSSVPTTFADRGFTVIDDSGAISLTGVSIVGDGCVMIRLGRDPVGTVKVYYGRKTTFNGHGNLCDSDPTVAPFAYEYTANSGDYPAANLTDQSQPLAVGKRYPLWNWCIAFVLAATPN